MKIDWKDTFEGMIMATVGFPGIDHDDQAVLAVLITLRRAVLDETPLADLAIKCIDFYEANRPDGDEEAA